MEIWDLYDFNRNKLDKTHVRGIPLPKNCYHFVVLVWIQNDQDELLLSKRHPDKHFGNLWECTGGSVITGETSIEGALRETKEELGLHLNTDYGKLLHSFTREEVIDAKWVTKDIYQQMLDDKRIVPTLHHFYEINKE
ncbi:NUDIX hydrolase [Aquibacillus rhizosphaerae]|uniref:NUDIX domain-containing protein n=1 Tax=Aquibacillus rhizosphaerae TaxID=3051431 RepID=A0ABT7LBB2_9BACI|nr:NUDIX domain-containing protein [Aquibacillus sp. LR5S19]MDL4843150.1 NUDIX domain-containing protein [Aquibacillus sp. LR5S19]